MELKLTTATGKASSKSVEVSEATFGKEFNEALVHQVVTAYLAGARQGTRATKNRSAVSGGGAKPWRQKGTGRARAGTLRSPVWVGGGKAFAFQPQDHSQKVNKKMYRSAIGNIFSELVRQERLVIVEKLDVEAPKTKALVEQLGKMALSNVLIVDEEISDNLYLSARNLPHVDVCAASRINPVSLVKHDKVLATVGAIKQIEGMLS